MKKQLLLSSLAMIGLSGAIIAQPTLTASGTNQVIGDIIPISTTSYVSPGSPGANQTWDLSSASVSGSQTYTVSAPSSTPYGTTFSNATVSMSANGAYIYTINTSSAWQNRGIVSPSGVVIDYSNVEDWLHYPCNYSNTFTDTWAAQFDNGGYTFYRSGYTEVTADGYGTIILPNGTFSNVMRVKFHQVYKDSVDIGFPYIINYDNDEYMWYLNGNHYPIATMYNLTNDAGSPSSGGTYLTSVVGIKENVDNSDLFTTFPSPASTQLTIDTKGSTTFENAEITSASGSKVMAVELTNNFGSSTIDVSNLASGVYFIELKNKEGITARRKFVVTH